MPTPSTALVPLRAALLAMLLVVGACAALLFGHALETGHGGPAVHGPSLSAVADGGVAPAASAVSEASASSAAPVAPDGSGEGLLALCLGVGCAIVLLLAGLRLRAAPLLLARRLGAAWWRPLPRPLAAPAPSVALDALGISRT
ncbi:hypothetical protein ACFOE1_08380 [Agromyces mediolanus]|uniref:Uncharacterized protein n=1 Tax=Agromyces mediolanus TaxID=41986 RepID=A0A918CCY6_AGRME|nr:hypothetical protein [Agromyces mediolanus]GGR17970.1 hypothetical protein GCM10010196_08790 [Agromyces mediolanus]GLJ71507.1 hypothetical protein GCM10017583_07630 [Agromyces mediolanus]